MPVRKEWEGKKFERQLRKQMREAVGNAAQALADEIDTTLRKNTATIDTGKVDQNTVRISSKRARYVASKPGQPPHLRTGTLANSIGAVETTDADSSRVRWIVGSSVKYSKYLEFGTNRMRARPFFQRSIDKARKRMERTFKATMQKAFK